MKKYHKCCVIYDCRNHSSKSSLQNIKDPKIHSIPSDTVVASKWLSWIDKANFPQFNPSRNKYVCGLHFITSDYMKNGKLFRNAVPSLKFPETIDQSVAEAGELEGNSMQYGENSGTKITLSSLLQSSEDSANNFSINKATESVNSRNKDQSISEAGELKNEHKESNCMKMEGTDSASTAVSADVSGHSAGNSMQCGENSGTEITLSSLLQSSEDPANNILINKTPESVNGEQLRLRNLSAVNWVSTGSSRNYSTPVKQYLKSRPGKRYVGELSPSDFATPDKARRNLARIMDKLKESNRKLHLERVRCARLRKKVSTLTDLVQHFKEGRKSH